MQRSERSESAGRAEGSAESAGAGAEVLAAATASAVDIDPVIHAQARLRIMATLAAVPVGDELHFPRLRELLDMTAGNLSTHLSKLEGAGYVQQNKTYSGRSPATYLALTPEGRVAFERYVRNLRALIDARGPLGRPRQGAAGWYGDPSSKHSAGHRLPAQPLPRSRVKAGWSNGARCRSASARRRCGGRQGPADTT